MNKPIIAAITGVSFGLFLGVLGYHYKSGCPRSAAVSAPAATPYVHPCPMMRQAMTQNNVIVQVVQVPSAPESTFDADDILADAQTAYVEGDYDRALSLAERAEEARPIRAHRIMGAVGCNTKDQELVDRMFPTLDAPGRQYMIYVCHRNDMSPTLSKPAKSAKSAKAARR